MKTSWQTKILAGILAASLIPFLTFMIMFLVPLKPIEIKSIKIQNPGNKVVAGDTVIYLIDSIKYTDKSAKIIRQIINERTTNYTVIESNIPPGRSIRSGSLTTARVDMPGQYYMNYTLIYNYFGFRDVSVTSQSDMFEIVPAPEGPRGPKGDKGPKGDTGGVTIFGK